MFVFVRHRIMRKDDVSSHQRLVAGCVSAIYHQMVSSRSSILRNHNVVMMDVRIAKTYQIIRSFEGEGFITGTHSRRFMAMPIKIVVNLNHVAAQHDIILEVALKVYSTTYEQFIAIFWLVQFNHRGDGVNFIIVVVTRGESERTCECKNGKDIKLFCATEIKSDKANSDAFSNKGTFFSNKTFS
mgnify:CR=1 FL=1